jgi:hypothetical protein
VPSFTLLLVTYLAPVGPSEESIILAKQRW